MNQLLVLILEWQMAVVAFAALLLIAAKEKQGALFACLTLASFLISFYLSPLIIKLDSGTYFYRYLFWILNDVAWMALISFLAIRDKIKMYQCVWGQLFVLPMMIAQVFRMADRFVVDFEPYTYIYKSVIPVANTAVVLLCFAPLIELFKTKLQQRFFSHSLTRL